VVTQLIKKVHLAEKETFKFHGIASCNNSITALPLQNENILLVHNEEGYNLLQKCVGINNVEMVRWILSRNPDVNRGACSLPLHIASLKG